MASFDAYLPTLLAHEGGFVNDPADPGGATNKGVTLKTFQACSQQILGLPPSLANLKVLTDQQAGEIYKALYWDKLRADEIACQELAEILFDFYVNAGGNAVKLLQKTLNDMGESLNVDGGFGPTTFGVLAAADQVEVYRRYKRGRIDYYQNLVAQQPSLAKFLKGWLNRVNSFPDL